MLGKGRIQVLVVIGNQEEAFDLITGEDDDVPTGPNDFYTMTLILATDKMSTSVTVPRLGFMLDLGVKRRER